MSGVPGVRAASALLVASIVLSAAAQLLLRAGMRFAGDDMLTGADLDTALAGWLHSGAGRAVALGLCCYAASMLCWLPALSRFELSFAYPLLAVSYVLVYIGAAYWPGLGETRSAMKLAGITLIVIGVYLVSSSGHAQAVRASSRSSSRRNIR